MKSMTTPLRRITRAKKHLDVLNREINAFLKSNPYTVDVYEDPRDGSYIFYPYLTKKLPLNWGFLVGEFVHGLHSALDNIAWSLAVVQDERTEFPIFLNNTPEFTTKLTKLRQDVRADVESVQPYNRPDREKHRHPLWVIRRMDIIDKHRIILPSITKLHIYTGIPNKFIYVDDAFTSLNKGDIELRLTLPSNLKQNFKPQIRAEVLFDISSKPAKRNDPIRISGIDLFGIYRYVRDYIYPLFAKFLEPEERFS